MALPGILPKILAPRAVAGREALARAMAQYYAMSGHHNGSQLTMARYSVLKSYMNDVDIARAECVHGLAVITNIVPAAFWTVYHVFSDPDVLSRVREELESLASIDEQTPDRKQNCVLDMSKLKDAHFLNSVIHETLRFRAGGTGPRMVLENVILSGEGCEYDIENGSTIILAHEAMHHNKAVWGANANEFVAGRFLDNRISNNAFRGFGGGANMCPGKGFATAQIVALVAMWVLQFDLEPIGGQWEEPGQDQSNMSRENTPALRKPIVEAFPRAGTENVVWRFRM